VSIDGSKSEGFNFSDQTAVIKNNHTYFIENKGQVIDQYGATRTDIDFRIPGGEGLNIFISSAGIHYQWSKPINQSNAISGNHLSASNNPIPYEMYRLDMELVGAKKPEAVIVDDRQPYYEWYYLPHCGPDGVKSDAYHRVVYCEVYPNIYWVLYIMCT